MSDHSITSLIEKLEEAEVGDQDLSLEVNLALEGGEAVPKMTNYTMEPCWAIRRPNAAYVGGFENGPNYPVTQSLDAALELAERVGWRVYTIDMSVVGRPSVMLQSLDDRPGTDAETGAHMIGKDYSRATAKTPALALCASILRAHQHDN